MHVHPPDYTPAHTEAGVLDNVIRVNREWHKSPPDRRVSDKNGIRGQHWRSDVIYRNIK